MKHTRGPWRLRISEKKNKHWAKIDADRWTSFAKVIVRMDDDDNDNKEGRANAKLIAAAPDLLKVLQDQLVVYNVSGTLLSFDVNQIREAIKKATL